MPRVKVVRTPLHSAPHLLAALRALGFDKVEEHDSPAPLVNWMGKPIDLAADVIVRRAQISGASDDLGFVRNELGTFDALLSELHLVRFDKRWLLDLARRHDALAAAQGLPPSTVWNDPRELFAEQVLTIGVANAPQQFSFAPRPVVVRAREPMTRDVDTLLDELRAASKRATGRGIGPALLPWLVTIVIGFSQSGSRRVAVFGVGFAISGIVFVLFAGAQHSRAMRATAAKFRARFANDAEEREAALERLNELARPGSKSAEDGLAQRLARVLASSTAIEPELAAKKKAK